MKLEMTSSLCSDSPARTNHFFKIILSNTHSQTKLMIPRKFVRNHGKNLGSRISLKAPNGLAWPVNLESRKGDVWLQNGWPEFARSYSIRFGHLLVFKYRGHCDFKVRIFDPSSTEMDYPSSRSEKHHIGESSQVRKREIECDHLTSSDVIRPRKKRVKNHGLEDASHNGVCLMPKLKQEKTKLGASIKEAEARALASAEAFKSNNPFFVHVMRRTYLDGKRRGLVVKKAFEEIYKKWKDNDQAILQVAGKSWMVNCNMNFNRCRLSFGWDRFARDNSLAVGDVCVFELIDACRKLLHVVIFRATKETSGDGGSAIEESKSKLALASAKDFKSHNPFFVSTMKLSYVDGNGRGVVVKKAFEKTYQMWKKDDQVILQVAEKTWVVYCDINNNGCRLRRGWNIFVKDNLLNVGDACVFELIDASKKLLQVFIFRAAKEVECKENMLLPRVNSEAKEARVPTSFNSSTANSYFFKVKVYPSSLYSSGTLSVPQKFIKKYITEDCCSVTLQISDGKTWVVKCKVYSSGTKFGFGWRIFARANHLAVGDVCVFKLINVSEKLLSVVIFRNKSSDFK